MGTGRKKDAAEAAIATLKRVINMPITSLKRDFSIWRSSIIPIINIAKNAFALAMGVTKVTICWGMGIWNSVMISIIKYAINGTERDRVCNSRLRLSPLTPSKMFLEMAKVVPLHMSALPISNRQVVTKLAGERKL